MRLVEIGSLEIPELQPYRTLRRQHDHIQRHIFVAEGAKVVRRLLASGLDIVSLLLTREWYEELLRSGDLDQKSPLVVYLAEKHLVESIVGYRLHQGIMAVGRVPQERSLDETMRTLPFPYFLVALDGLANAENVGVVVRNAAALGVQAIVVGPTSSSPYLRRAVRNSMGGVFKLPIVHVDNLSDSLRFLHKTRNVRLIDPDPHAPLNLEHADLGGNICIVLGNEEEGVSPDVRGLPTERIAIRMHNNADSLNVASASAVFLYEVGKKRNRAL